MIVRDFSIGRAAILAIFGAGFSCLASFCSGEKLNQNVQLDTSKAKAVFVDVAQANSTSRHIVLDFGLRPVLASSQEAKPTATLRMYQNYFTAKRTYLALNATIERHIEVFGPLDEVATAEMLVPVEIAQNPNYANFARLTGTPDELIFEFGIISFANHSPEAVQVSHTVIMDFHTGKSLLQQLRSILGNYEKEHGPIETDVNKRVIDNY